MSRRAFKKATHRLAICIAVMLGFSGSIYLYSAINLAENTEFLPLPFALGIFTTLLSYGIVRLIGWLIAPIFSKERRRVAVPPPPATTDKAPSSPGR